MKTTRKQWSKVSFILGIVLLTSLVFATGALADSRDLSDWLSQQGNNSTFAPPDPDLAGWNISTAFPITPFALIDYAGKATNAYPNPVNNPQITGTINESPLLSGENQVTVSLQTQNANAYVFNYNYNSSDPNQFLDNPTIFGHRPFEVRDGFSQALADCSLTLVFNNSAPNQILPDMVALIGNYDGIVESDYIYYLFSATALGLLADGTPGELTVLQEGTWDGKNWSYTEEIINVEAVPIPPAVLLFGTGLAGLAGLRRFRKG